MKASEEYINKRYEDTSPRILQDIKQGKGLYNSYIPWIQHNITVYFSSDKNKIKQYWLDQVPLYYHPNTWSQSTRHETECDDRGGSQELHSKRDYHLEIRRTSKMREGNDLTNRRSSVCTIL